MPDVLAQYGRFLEEDYRMAIESMWVPEMFDEDLTPTGRRFVIVGGKDNPTLFCKSVFLCLKLAGPERIDVRSTQLDETFMVQNLLEHHAGDIPYRVFVPAMEGIGLNNDWNVALENATDIVVFGNNNAINTYRDYETVNRRVWEYNEKFSFGVVRSEDLGAIVTNSICFDFAAYYGDGRLAPKLYFVIGNLTKKMIDAFSENMIAIYRPFIEQYRSKLPLTRKSDFAQQYILSHYEMPYVRIDRLDMKDPDWNVLQPLYGDVRLIQVDELDDVKDFIIKYKDSISTVAINSEDDWDTLDLLDDMMIPRVCEFGDMQFPGFFEQYDVIDDFEIYVTTDEYEYEEE